MRLDEILQLRVDHLYNSYKTLYDECESKQTEVIGYETEGPILEDFLKDGSTNINGVDTAKITSILAEYGYYADTDIESELRTIKVVQEAINSGLAVELTNSQRNTLDSYIEHVRDCHTKILELVKSEDAVYTELTNKLETLEKEIGELEFLILRISDPDELDILTEEDLELVMDAIKEMPAETKQDALIRFRQYNHDRIDGKTKKSTKVDLGEFARCFIQVGIDESRLSRAIKKNEDEILGNASISNTKKILEFFGSVDLLRKFELPVLMTICIYGNYDSCKRTYDEMLANNMDSDLCVSVPSIWINNIQKSPKRAPRRQGNTSQVKEPTLREAAHTISFNELKANQDYLAQKGLNINDGLGIRRILCLPHYRVKEAVELFEEYGLLTDQNRSKFKPYLLGTAALADRLDTLTELGLLNGEADQSELHNYGNRFLSTVQCIEVPVYSVLASLKQSLDKRSYYDNIASDRRGRISGKVTIDKLGVKIDNLAELAQYNKEHFVDPATDIPNVEEYEDVIGRSTNTEISEKVMNNPVVVEFDKNYLVNDYLYNFGGVEISRIKFLRNLSNLIESGRDDEYSVFYSAIRGSLLTPESYKKLKTIFVLPTRNVSSLGGARI